jgi:hypothetical protein
MTVALVLSLALPGLAWMQHTEYGVPGAVYGNNPSGAVGGICGDPYAAPVTCPAYPNDDQMFVTQYTAKTTASAVSQTITSHAFLYWWNTSTNSWVHSSTISEGSCTYRAGQGVGGCRFGSPAYDDGAYPACASNRYLCVPAFIGLTRGYHWMVQVRVSWYNSGTGGLLAQAVYHPRGTVSDIKCAGYAERNNRCSGPYTLNGYGNLYMTP